MRRRWAALLTATALTGAALVLGNTAPADAAPDGISQVKPYTGGAYVAMGDSRASGTHQTPTLGYYLGCLRSADSYPEMLRKKLQPALFTDTSCAGATSANLWSTPQRTNVYPRPAQIEQVPAGAQLLTISIGGNDMQWGAILAKCLVSRSGEDRNCRGDAALNARVDQRIAAMDRATRSALSAIRAKQPKAQIVMVGLGGFIGERGCFPTVPLPDGDAAWMRDVFQKANTTLRAVAESIDGSFIDVQNLSEGRDACAKTGAWYEGQTNEAGTLRWHFNHRGSTEIATLIERVIIR
ncbi:MAG: SGNH/GDSL hydrolase family protein [Gordonia sp. (in: high G+C Gram-positive bacteria)]|uniref:SGNH/GDSL hydrolase family protein n=1 Tax=Gordonia sp. (in: high G+C Gram-positive bacteria) TaxID=84139 RepID=UPI003BB70075